MTKPRSVPKPIQWYRRFASIVAGAALAVACIASLPGCVALYGSRAVTIEVVDGDSGKPLPNAAIAVRPHDAKLTLNAPSAVDATTDEAGVASLRLATYAPMYWRISAPGYEDLDDVVDTEFLPSEVRKLSAGGEQLRGRVALFRPPPPEIVVVLPDEYRGPVAIAIGADASGEPVTVDLSRSVRSIELAMQPDGRLRASLPTPFNRIDEMNPRIRIRTRSGSEIATARIDVAPDEVRQRRICNHFDHAESRMLFVVGTTEDAARILDTVNPTTLTKDGRRDRRTDWIAFDRYFGGQN